LPEHWVVVGAHTPWHPPLTHAEFVHVTGVPHVPLALHVWKPVLLEHCVAPGVHTPVQAPFAHAAFTQDAAVLHWPLALQV
jgi:hypothetical protein